MGNQVFANRASALLAASIGSGDTVIQVAAGFGALFPSPGASETARIRLVDASGNLEIVELTTRTGDLLTVVRAQEGTTAAAWTLNVTRVELSLTKETMEKFIQRDGDNLTGNLNAAGNEVQNAELTGATVVTGGQTVGTAIRGALDDASNEIAVPNDGSRATAGGSPLVVLADNLMELLPIGAIILWYTGLGSLPTGWQLCDGSNGSPDLRDNFVRGAGGSFSLGATGGSATASGNTGTGGSHTPAGSISSTVLTASQIPTHSHRVLSQASGGGIGDTHIGNAVTPITVLGGFRGVTTTQYIQTNSTGQDVIENAGAGAGHTHTFSGSVVPAHTHSLASVSVIPPYHAVYYVMKVA